MNDQTLVGRMIQICVRPEDVKKVRGLVLSLAISGKLTSKEVSSEDISETFVIPSDWKWCTLSEIAACRGSAKAGSDGIKPSDWILDMEDIDGATGTVHTRATFRERSSLSTKSAFKPGDVLYGKLRPYLNKVVLADSPGFCTTEIIPITPGSAVESRYLQLALRSPYFLRYVAKRSYGMKMPRLGTKDLESSRIPLPPLAEQKRIVAKVDELMALCDRLEVQLKERDVKQAALAKAALAKFTEDPTPENLQLLFHPSFSIEPEDIKTCILSLALKGHLCRQFATEGTATKDLSEAGVDINKWKVDETERRYDIPASWTWLKFGGAGDQRLGKMLDEAKNTGELKPYLRNTSVQWMRFNLEDVKLMRIEKDDQEELRLRKGDLLICEGGQPGRCAIWEDNTDEMYFQKALHRVRPCCAIDSRYLAMNLRYDCTSKVIDSLFTGATIKHLTGRSLSAYSIPVPPHKEQLRIIDQFEVLMNLVNSLEAQLEASRTTGEKLLEAMVAELTAA